MSVTSPAPEPEPEPETSEDKKHRRPWLIAGGITMVLLGLLAFLYLKDDAPPDDSDFRPAWTEGGGTGNPLAIFVEEIRTIDTHQWRSGILSMEEFVAKNGFVFPAFDKLMATDSATWRLPDVNGTGQEDMDVITMIQTVGMDVISRKMVDHLEKGERDEAIDLALALDKLGCSLLTAESGLPLYETTHVLQETAVRHLLRALSEEPSPELLRKAQEGLSGREPKCQELATTLKAEHDFEKGHLLESMHDDWIFNKLFPYQTPDVSRRWFRPYRTIGHHLKLSRQIATDLNQGWALTQANADAWLLATDDRIGGKWTRYANPNFVGDIILKRRAPWNIARETAARITIRRMLIASLAIRRFELMHHTSLRTLDELVPRFLSAVPVDAMNQAPLTWDATSRELRAESHWQPCDASLDYHRHQFLNDFSGGLEDRVELDRDARIYFLLNRDSGTTQKSEASQ